MLACDRMSAVSQSAWQQLELSLSNVADTDSQPDLQQSANQLLTAIRNNVVVQHPNQ